MTDDIRPEPKTEPDPKPVDPTLAGLDPGDLLDLAKAPTAVQAGRFVPPTPEEMDRLIPDYAFQALIGQGGMGAVYKAVQKRLDRIVAVKVLPPELAKEAGFTQRFEREAKALARLSHPNLVAVHDFGLSGEWCYLVMEFVDGANLREVMRTGRLTPSEALAIVPQICSALQYAHDQGVVHRDIKPENILLDQRGRVRIADFGLAKLRQDPDNAGQTLTLSGSVLGTVHYMAPEQVEGCKDVDHRADIYSLGVVFYEMLTGSLPIGRFDPPSRKLEVDVRLDEVVLRTLEKDRDRRYQQADQVATAVENATKVEPKTQEKTSEKTEEIPANPDHVVKVGNIEIGNGIVRIGDQIRIDEHGVRIGKRWIASKESEDQDGDDDDEDEKRDEKDSSHHHYLVTAAILMIGALATDLAMGEALRHSIGTHWVFWAAIFSAPFMAFAGWHLFARLSPTWASIGLVIAIFPALATWWIHWTLGIVVAIVYLYLVSNIGGKKWHQHFTLEVSKPAKWIRVIVWIVFIILLMRGCSNGVEPVRVNGKRVSLPGIRVEDGHVSVFGIDVKDPSIQIDAAKKTGDENDTTPSEEELHAKILAVSKDPVLADMVVACINAPWYERWPEADGQVEMQVIGENLANGDNLLERVREALVASDYFVVLSTLTSSSPQGLTLRIKGDAQSHFTSAQLVNGQGHLLWAWHPTTLEVEAAPPTRSASSKTILP